MIWIKPLTCSGGDCVELAQLPDGRIAIRDSKNPDGALLVFTKAEIAAFFTGIREGDFDHLFGAAKLRLLAEALQQRADLAQHEEQA